jgi:hypothetical protein
MSGKHPHRAFRPSALYHTTQAPGLQGVKITPPWRVTLLTPEGVLVVLVPSGMRRWCWTRGCTRRR